MKRGCDTTLKGQFLAVVLAFAYVLFMSLSLESGGKTRPKSNDVLTSSYKKIVVVYDEDIKEVSDSEVIDDILVDMWDEGENMNINPPDSIGPIVLPLLGW